MPLTRPTPRAPALPTDCDHYRGWPLKYLGHKQRVKEPGYRIYAPWTGEVLFIEPNRAEAERRIDQQVQAAEEASARAQAPGPPSPERQALIDQLGLLAATAANWATWLKSPGGPLQATAPGPSFSALTAAYCRVRDALHEVEATELVPP